MMIRYTRHARVRMRERRVSEEQVEAVVLSPDNWRYGDDDEIIATKKLGKRKVKVFYLSLPEEMKVITVIVD
jgi:hypothetical protein